MPGGKQQGGQTRDPLRASSWRHHKHGRHSSVRSPRSHLHRSGQRLWPQLRTDSHHQVCDVLYIVFVLFKLKGFMNDIHLQQMRSGALAFYCSLQADKPDSIDKNSNFIWQIIIKCNWCKLDRNNTKLTQTILVCVSTVPTITSCSLPDHL